MRSWRWGLRCSEETRRGNTLRQPCPIT
jgi:hypothetical protein